MSTTSSIDRASLMPRSDSRSVSERVRGVAARSSDQSSREKVWNLDRLDGASSAAPSAGVMRSARYVVGSDGGNPGPLVGGPWDGRVGGERAPGGAAPVGDAQVDGEHRRQIGDVGGQLQNGGMRGVAE